MSSAFQFPIELFRNPSSPLTTNQTANPESLASLYFLSAAGDHWSTYLLHQKTRYQIKTYHLLKRALQKKDILTIQKWYIAGLFNDTRYFSGSELDIMEQIVNGTQDACINPLLEIERGNNR